MARYKSIPRHVWADRLFPVRIRITQPADGFGQKLSEMHHWLHARVGLEHFYQWGKMSTAAHEDLLFYFEDLVVAREFVDHFDCASLIRRSGEIPPGA